MEQLLNLLQLLKSLLNHEGIAYVFEDIEDLKENIDKPDLPVTKDYHSCFKRVRPKGYPGMPEVGNMPIPKVLVEQGRKRYDSYF